MVSEVESILIIALAHKANKNTTKSHLTLLA